MKRKVDELNCPCCKQSRSFYEYQTFVHQLSKEVPSKTYVTSKGEILGNAYLIEAKRKKVDWACDNCLQGGLALKGIVRKQLFCDFPPHFPIMIKKKSVRYVLMYLCLLKLSNSIGMNN